MASSPGRRQKGDWVDGGEGERESGLDPPALPESELNVLWA